MDSYRETFETWNKIANLYQDRFMDLDLYNHSYDLICKSIRKQNAGILEIGCGPGNITRYLLSKRPDFKILGIDIAPNMIALAKKNNPTATFKVMDCRQIGELETLFDGIIGGFCLPYLSYPHCAQLVSESYRLLSKNGLLYLSFVEGDSNKSGFKVGSNGDRVYFHYHNLDALKKLLTQNAFQEPEVYHVDYQRTEALIEKHTILISSKK
ncbi:trans-aconitate 2-methyltransferase [Arenibacter sp. ARW7G5Y1]|uniref:class I SAM-dependent methyltransferase n=1 Tax=Arenibacter sp. ARW7G5Y1 TaxID=2135619 RepID=UPI000D75D525|nr:class I SAM-dependent methyltransferase [Arenibacter sp. ARW7G5Y1]PXX24294.1 methyltransferase family protein [Arenibacter sp. ARW7G5Y1]